MEIKIQWAVSMILCLLILAGCGAAQPKEQKATASSPSGTDQGGLTEIRFEDFFTPSAAGEGQISEKMIQLNGKKVGIKGYMTELTPIDNRFIYLVPTQGAACPFCSADNPKYLEAIAVYPSNGEAFPYTEQGLWVYGTMEVGEKVDEATGLISMFRLRSDSIEPYQAR